MEVTEILKNCKVENNTVKLPGIQLERNNYLEVKKALELIGGKWKGGKTQGFVFDEDPTEYLSHICEGEKINLKKEFQFFATPDCIADQLVQLAFETPNQIGKVLEPSAGDGAIIKAIHRYDPDIFVNYCELMELNLMKLQKLENSKCIGNDFLTLELPEEEKFASIIANPPFSKNQDIDHVYKMIECLTEGGRLVSIMSNHWRFTSGKKEIEFQKLISESESTVIDIEEGAFKESGTNVSACIVVINKTSQSIVSGSTKASKKVNKTQKSNQHEGFSLPTEPQTKLPPKPETSLTDFQNSFNSFAYQYGQSEVFVDFLDYVLLVFRWWETSRDFSYFEKKYKNLYSKFPHMLELLSNASDNLGEGFRDALGDLFMELVSQGRNGQFFTPDNVCDMMSMMTMAEIKDNEKVLDPACGSGRMLLSAGKRNRNAWLFGCDNDITCCKMATINLLLNTLKGEIALMDSLRMDYTKSWEVSYRNHLGANMPVYRVVENKDDSQLWKLHINSFNQQKTVSKEILPTEILEQTISNLKSAQIPMNISPTNQIKQQKYTQLQLF